MYINNRPYQYLIQVLKYLFKLIGKLCEILEKNFLILSKKKKISISSF